MGGGRRARPAAPTFLAAPTEFYHGRVRSNLFDAQDARGGRDTVIYGGLPGMETYLTDAPRTDVYYKPKFLDEGISMNGVCVKAKNAWLNPAGGAAHNLAYVHAQRQSGLTVAVTAKGERIPHWVDARDVVPRSVAVPNEGAAPALPTALQPVRTRTDYVGTNVAAQYAPLAAEAAKRKGRRDMKQQLKQRLAQAHGVPVALISSTVEACRSLEKAEISPEDLAGVEAAVADAVALYFTGARPKLKFRT